MIEEVEFLTPKSESSGTGQETQDEGASSERDSSVAKIKSKVEPLKINAEDLPF
jgi:hypothetical protein